VAVINRAIEREYATRKLTRADIQEQIAAILLQEQEAVRRGQLRRSRMRV
jgi:hypothetical protein